MDIATTFLIIGVGTAVLAVLVALFGIRNHGFPKTNGAALGLIAVFAILLIGTGYAAWETAVEHQEEHRAHEAEIHEEESQ